VLGLSVLMDFLVFRPLRTHSPAVMLVATFAVAFLLQSIALLVFGPLGKSAGQLAILNAPWDIGGVFIKKIAVISFVTAIGCLVILQLLLTRTPLGLHMRAAAMDFRTARLLGVRANWVISGAVIVSGLFAAVSAVTRSSCSPESCSAASTGRFPPRSAASRSASRAGSSAACSRRTRASTCRVSSSRR
jgi:branched-chain amino acid transport system permease protein